MNVTVPRAELVRELTLSEKAVSRKPTIASLNGALMETRDGAIAVAATNLELGLVTRCAATVHAPGRQVVPVVKLLELVKSLSVPEIQLQADGGALVVAGGSFRARLQTYPVEDFPVLPVPDGVTESLPPNLLRRLILLTRFAVTEDDKRYYLAGGQLEIGESTLRMVTSDAHTLAKAEGSRPPGAACASVLIPRRTMDALAFLLEDADGKPLTYTQGENHLFFAVDGRLLVSKQIAAQFPVYERVIPSSNTVRVGIGRAALTDAMRRAAMLGDMDGRKVTLSSDSLALTVSAARADVGSGDESVEATHEGPPLAVTINPVQVLDFLDVVGTDRVVMTGTTADRALVFSPDGGDVAYTYVIMPLR